MKDDIFHDAGAPLSTRGSLSLTQIRSARAVSGITLSTQVTIAETMASVSSLDPFQAVESSE